MVACLPVRADLPMTYRAFEHELTLRGQATLRVGYVFKVYDAALYLGEGAPVEKALADIPKRLEIRYLRDIAARDIIRLGNETLKRQETAETWSVLQDRLARINAWYQDVKPGDQYTLTYVPGHGCELALNGKVLGRIEGADFAAAYFGIWLDERTRYPEFRSTLLGLADRSAEKG